jgi:predicted transposase/invertase (TIGR01784 family)
MPEISNPHDRFFKRLLAHSEAAHDFIRYYLPPEVVRLLDLSTLEQQKDSFVDAELRSHFSDVLYSVQTKGGAGVHIYVLIEHKSYPELWVAFQLLRYMVRIWEGDLEREKRLLPIIPVVLYHGVAKWQVPPTLWGLVEGPEEMRPYVPDYRYWLCDLSAYSDEEIKGAVLLQMGLLTLKYILRDDLGAHLAQIFGLGTELARQETGLEYLETLLRYLTRGTDKIEAEELREAVEATIPEGGALMATIAAKWKEEGRQEGLAIAAKWKEEGRKEGLEEGLEQGLEKGLKQGALRQLLRVLEHRFGPVPRGVEARLQALSAARLETLLDIALDAASLDEFIRQESIAER